MYKRILLKLSGEQLQGKFDSGFDADRAKWIAGQLKPALDAGTQIVIMIGGGNYARGAQLSGDGVQRVTADYVGMLATLMNGLSLCDVLNDNGVDARVLTNVQADQVADRFTHRRALNHLKKGRIVIVSGGTGRPYLTTDTAAVNLALEMDCETVFKATKVDGVYDRDPAKYPDAVKYDNLTLTEAASNPEIKVMDKAAIGLASDHHITLTIFDLLTDGNIFGAIKKENVGTKVTNDML